MPASVAPSTIPAAFPTTAEAARAAAVAAGVTVGQLTMIPELGTAWVVVATSFGGHEHIALVTGDERVAWNVAADSVRFGPARVEAHPFVAADAMAAAS